MLIIKQFVITFIYDTLFKMSGSQEVKDFVSMAVCGLADRPEKVSAEIQSLNETALCVVIHCEAFDIKKVIGRNGKNIEAIRTLAQAISAKNKLMSVIQIKE